MGYLGIAGLVMVGIGTSMVVAGRMWNKRKANLNPDGTSKVAVPVRITK
jgi:hypothetical protein